MTWLAAAALVAVLAVAYVVHAVAFRAIDARLSFVRDREDRGLEQQIEQLAERLTVAETTAQAAARDAALKGLRR